MKIKMKTDHRIALDGVDVVVLESGEVYDVADEHGERLVDEGLASKSTAKEAKDAGATAENKDAGDAPENKGA